jgi:hypothetical protein
VLGAGLKPHVRHGSIRDEITCRLALPGKDLVVDEYLSFENIQNKKLAIAKLAPMCVEL